MRFLILRYCEEQRFKVVFTVVLFIVLYSVFVNVVNFTDDAYFGGDTWEYQSMGVNFAKGHGISKFGGIESFDTYKFAKADPLPAYYPSFVGRAGENNFYRTPAYPLLLGVVYRIFGVKPVIAKHVQLFQLILIAVCLPWIGHHCWKLEGLISGLITGPIYLATNYKFAEVILSETLTAFSIFLIVVGYLFFEKRSNTLSSVVLGGSLGFALLVKKTLVLIPLFLGIWILYAFYRQREKQVLKNLLTITVSAMVLVLPWSLYASIQSNSLVLLSIQGRGSLLDGNNEFNSDGGWHPEWRDRKNSFYNSDSLNGAPVIVRVAHFYVHHPDMFPKLIVKKLIKGFVPMMFLMLTFAVFIVERYGVFIETYVKNKSYISGYYTFAISFLTLSFFGTYSLSKNPSYPSQIFCLNPWISGFLLIAIFLPLFFTRFRDVRLKIPTIFLLIFFNFFTVTAAFFVDGGVYQSRLIKVMDFIFILTAIQYVLTFTNTIIKKLMVLTT